MLSKNFFLNIIYILLLIVIQVFVASNFDILSKYNPIIFIIWILFYPVKENSNTLIFTSFCIGLGVDFFLGTLGVNAFCALILVVIRQFILKKVIAKNSHLAIRFNELNFLQIILYVFALSMCYNVLVYSLESFSFGNFIYTLLGGTINGLISTFFILLIYLFIKKKLAR